MNDITTQEEKFNLSVIEKPVATQMLAILNRNEVISPEDNKFLADHSVSLQKTLVNTWIWRTQAQHESILSDQFHPTMHSKFHQAILEQKVQFTESVRLAKEYSILQLRKEEKMIELEELEERKNNVLSIAGKFSEDSKKTEARELRKAEIAINRVQIELQEIAYQLTEMKIAMDYRMKEVRSWEEIKEALLAKMQSLGLSEEQIYNKEFGELESYFYLFVNNLRGLEKSTDGGEVNNLIGLARWIWNKARVMGVLAQLLERCTAEQILLINKYKPNFE